jgi:hypothetical protein
MQDTLGDYTFTVERDPDLIKRVRENQKEVLMGVYGGYWSLPWTKHLCNVCGKRVPALHLNMHPMQCEG